MFGAIRRRNAGSVERREILDSGVRSCPATGKKTPRVISSVAKSPPALRSASRCFRSIRRRSAARRGRCALYDHTTQLFDLGARCQTLAVPVSVITDHDGAAHSLESRCRSQRLPRGRRHRRGNEAPEETGERAMSDLRWAEDHRIAVMEASAFSTGSAWRLRRRLEREADESSGPAPRARGRCSDLRFEAQLEARHSCFHATRQEPCACRGHLRASNRRSHRRLDDEISTSRVDPAKSIRRIDPRSISARPGLPSSIPSRASGKALSHRRLQRCKRRMGKATPPWRGRYAHLRIAAPS